MSKNCKETDIHKEIVSFLGGEKCVKCGEILCENCDFVFENNIMLCQKCSGKEPVKPISFMEAIFIEREQKEKDFENQLFLRVTHTYNHITNSFEPRKNLQNVEFKNSNIKERTPTGVHALDSGVPTTIEEIIKQNKEYYESFKGDFDFDKNEECYSKETIIHDLKQLIELGIVVAVKNI